MEHFSLELTKVHILRVDIGEDILLSIQAFLSEAGIQQAVILGGYGTMAAYHLHWVTHNKLPTDNLFQKGEGGIEILAMNGLVVNGKPHIHISLSNPEGAFGGHLEPGCIAYVVCEIYFGEVSGLNLTRESTRRVIKGMGESDILRLVSR